MAKDKIRYYVVKRKRAFWQPTMKMRRLGFLRKALGEAGPAAQAEAILLNEQWDQFRLGIDPATQPRYPRGSLGEAWEAFRKTDEWKKKTKSTRDDWDRAWTWIEAAFGDCDPKTVQFTAVSKLRATVADLVSEREAHRVLKIWRAFWRIMGAMGYCSGRDDPGLAVKNPSPAGRQEFWIASEVEELIGTARRREFPGLALALAVAWDSQMSPVDVRSMTLAQFRSDANGVWLDMSRAKTHRDGVGTLSAATVRQFHEYFRHLSKMGIEPGPNDPILRTRRGQPYSKDVLSKDFRVIRSDAFPGDERTIADLRRSGAVEAVTGGVNPAHLSAKMANSIATAKELEATYVPVVVEIVREADESRLKGREKLKDRPPGRQEVGTMESPNLEQVMASLEQVIEMTGARDGARTRDLRRDRPAL